MKDYRALKQLHNIVARVLFLLPRKAEVKWNVC